MLKVVSRVSKLLIQSIMRTKLSNTDTTARLCYVYIFCLICVFWVRWFSFLKEEYEIRDRYHWLKKKKSQHFMTLQKNFVDFSGYPIHNSIFTNIVNGTV